MAFVADRGISPTSKLVINQLTRKKTPQSVIDISNALSRNRERKTVLASDRLPILRKL